MVRYILLAFVFVACTCAVRAQALVVEEDVLPRLDSMLAHATRATEVKDYELVTRYNDSIRYTLIGKTVSGGYLEDQNGRIWNMGVLDMPYVLLTTHHKMLLTIESMKRIADEFADEVMVFLMVARPDGEEDRAKLDGAGDNLVVVFEDDVRGLRSPRTDTRLIGLIGYPITYYVNADRTIALVDWGQMSNQSRAYKARKKKVKMLLNGKLKMNWRNQ